MKVVNSNKKHSKIIVAIRTVDTVGKFGMELNLQSLVNLKLPNQLNLLYMN